MLSSTHACFEGVTDDQPTAPAAGMGSKKRRKSPAPAEEQASKRSVSRGGRPALLSWTPGTLKAVLPSERVSAGSSAKAQSASSA